MAKNNLKTILAEGRKLKAATELEKITGAGGSNVTITLLGHICHTIG
jgi:hypothetical protein